MACRSAVLATLRRSIHYMDRWTTDRAERELVAWATASACRDDVVIAAHRAGVSKARIHAITGIARTTIDRILKEHPVRRGLLQMAAQEEITEFLNVFIQAWPRDPTWNNGPFLFRPRPAMAYQTTASEIAQELLAMAEFRALRLGSWLNTPNGELIAAAVEQLTPPPYRMDTDLLIDALQIAARSQQRAEREKALGIGVVSAIGAVLVSAARG
jgi:hypothetical protein